MGSWGSLAIVVGFFVYVWLNTRVRQRRSLAIQVLRRPVHWPAEPGEVDPELRAALAAPQARLASLGFESTGISRARLLDCADDELDYFEGYIGDGGQTAAWVLIAPVGFDPARPLLFEFSTELDDGTFLETWGVKALGGLTRPAAGSEAHGDRSVSSLLDVHRARVAASGKGTVAFTPADVQARTARSVSASLDDSLARGDLVVDGDSGDRFRLSPASLDRLAPLPWQAKPTVSAPATGQVVEPPDFEMPAVPAWCFARRHRAIRRFQQAQASSGANPVSFLLSAGVFAAVGLVLWEGLFVLQLMFVLLVHELGHVLAMRLSGFKDTSILFIPFLGAVARGHKKDASPSQQAFISLAGPAPGLIVGALIVMATMNGLMAAHAALIELAVLALLVNLLNLLPVLPQDGGHVVRHLVVGRRPTADLLLRVVSVAALLVAWSRFDESWALFFAILLGMSLPAAMRLRETWPWLSEAANEVEAYRALLGKDAASRPPENHWFLLVEEILARRKERSVPVGVAVVWLTLQAALLAGGLLVVLPLVL